MARVRSYSLGVYHRGPRVPVPDVTTVDRGAVPRTRSCAGPWGPFHLAATERGVVAVEWLTTARTSRTAPAPAGSERDRVQAADAADDDPRRPTSRRGHRRARGLLAGRPPRGRPCHSTSPTGPAWDRAVLRAVADVPWGATASYGEIARRIGSPRRRPGRRRRVGRNPIGLLIPATGSSPRTARIGGYGGDAWGSRQDRLAIKRSLLLREGVTVPATGRLDSPPTAGRRPGQPPARRIR